VRARPSASGLSSAPYSDRDSLTMSSKPRPPSGPPFKPFWSAVTEDGLTPIAWVADVSQRLAVM